jgi:hypothetical protein
MKFLLSALAVVAVAGTVVLGTTSLLSPQNNTPITLSQVRPTPVTADLSTIPNCTSLTGPTIVEINKPYTYQLTAQENTNTVIDQVAISINNVDAQENPLCTVQNNNSHGFISTPASGTGTYPLIWTPNRPGQVLVYGRVWNDGIASCRAACTTADPASGTKESNLCIGADQCKLLVTIIDPATVPNCPPQQLKGDYNCDTVVNTKDKDDWQRDYGYGIAPLDLFEYWRRAFFPPQ